EKRGLKSEKQNAQGKQEGRQLDSEGGRVDLRFQLLRKVSEKHPLRDPQRNERVQQRPDRQGDERPMGQQKGSVAPEVESAFEQELLADESRSERQSRHGGERHEGHHPGD